MTDRLLGFREPVFLERRGRSTVRQKVKKLIVTFDNTTDAMAFEKACHSHDMPGRVIPVPRSISVSCGISWSVPLEEEERMRRFVEEQGLAFEGYHYAEVY